MKWYFQIASAILLITGIVACSPMVPAAKATADLQKTSGDAYHPFTTRTGIGEIDRILDVSSDVQMLRPLIQFTSARCTKLDGLGGPPKCLEGEGEGTPVDVLPFLDPEGSFLRRDGIQNWQGFEAAGLYAIYEVSPNAFSDENYPVGEYAILFVGKENQPAISLRVSNDRIVRVDYIFDDSPESLDALLQREATHLILAPVSR